MKKRDIKKIRSAIMANHGGFDDATDSQIMSVWQELDLETRTRYLDNLKGKKNDAIDSR